VWDAKNKMLLTGTLDSTYREIPSQLFSTISVSQDTALQNDVSLKKYMVFKGNIVFRTH
jgi:hypothetical protein